MRRGDGAAAEGAQIVAAQLDRWPALGSRRPSSMRARVDLPQPDSPTMPSTSPLRDGEIDPVDGMKRSASAGTGPAPTEKAARQAACDEERRSCGLPRMQRQAWSSALRRVRDGARAQGGARVARSARGTRSRRAAPTSEGTDSRDDAEPPPGRVRPGHRDAAEQTAGCRGGADAPNSDLPRSPSRRSRPHTSRRRDGRCARRRRGRG